MKIERFTDKIIRLVDSFWYGMKERLTLKHH